MVKKYGITTMVALAVAVLIWSTTFAALVVTLEHFSAEHLLFVRWTLTSVLFAGVAVFKRLRLPALADVPRIAFAGLLGIGLYQLLLVKGQAGVSASMAGFLINLAPMFTTVIAVALRKETATWATWVGIAVCTLGLAVMGHAAGGMGTIGVSSSLVIAAALCFASYTVYSKPLLARYRPLELTAYATIVGSVPFLIFAPGSMAAVAAAPPVALATIAILAVFHGCLAFVLFSYAVSGMPPGTASRFLYLIPVLGLGVAWAWIAEVPSALTIAGGLLTVAGVAISSVRLTGLAIRRTTATAAEPSRPSRRAAEQPVAEPA